MEQKSKKDIETLIESRQFELAKSELMKLLTKEQVLEFEDYSISIRDSVLERSAEAISFYKGFYDYLKTTDANSRFTEHVAFCHYSKDTGYSWHSIQEVFEDTSIDLLDSDNIKVLKFGLSLLDTRSI